MTTVLVEYVGRKARATDRVGGTKKVWEGSGDVHAVPLSAWEKMSKHPDMWRLVEKGEGTSLAALSVKVDTLGHVEGLGSAKCPNLEAMDKDQLHALAKERGVKVHPNAGAEKVLAALKAAGV